MKNYFTGNSQKVLVQKGNTTLYYNTKDKNNFFQNKKNFQKNEKIINTNTNDKNNFFQKYQNFQYYEKSQKNVKFTKENQQNP